MKHTFETHTPESIARLAASDPNVTVMEESYDRTFTPLPGIQVEKMARRAAAVAAEHSDAAAVRALLADDDEMGRFSEHYTTMYEKVTTPSFVKDARNMKTLFDMIQTYRRAEAGHITSRDASGRAMALAIDHKLASDGRRSGSERGSATPPRVEEEGVDGEEAPPPPP